jgi:hypothetical protein
VNSSESHVINILIFDGENATDISHKIESLGGMTSVSSGDIISKVQINASMMPEIANILGVKYIEKYIMPRIISISNISKEE